MTFSVLDKNGRRRVAGELVGRILKKAVQGSRHLLRKPPGWAIDEDILRRAQAAGAETVCILDRESGKTYTSPLETIFSKGIKFDRGFGEQICLPLCKWLVS